MRIVQSNFVIEKVNYKVVGIFYNECMFIYVGDGELNTISVSFPSVSTTILGNDEYCENLSHKFSNKYKTLVILSMWKISDECILEVQKQVDSFIKSNYIVKP